MNLYKSFVENFSHIQLLRQVEKLLKWDYRTYMPSGAIEIRSQQIAYMASLAHKEATSEIYQEALQQMVDIETGVVKIKGLNFFQEANLREWAKDFNRHIKLPLSFVKEYYRVITISAEIWKKARQLADFNMFSPWLEKVVTLNQEKARLLGYREHPYDALLELYEPEITSAIVCDLFSDLKTFLTGIVEQTNGESSPDEAHFINGFANEKNDIQSIAFGNHRCK